MNMFPLLASETVSTSAAAWAHWILDLTLKSSILLAVVGLVSFGLRHRSAATRHLLWTLGVAGVLVLPLLTAVLPDWRLPILPDLDLASVTRVAEAEVSWAPGPVGLLDESAIAASPSPPVVSQTAVVATPAPRDRAHSGFHAVALLLSQARPAVWLYFLWFTGIFLVLFSFLVSVFRLWQLVRNAAALDAGDWTEALGRLQQEYGLTGKVQLLRTLGSHSPLAFGLTRAVILLPENCGDWDRVQRDDVLRHELAHVKRGDGWSQVMANVLCLFYWFNPLVWLAAGRMRVERELACDDQVILRGARPSAYASSLLAIARSLTATSGTSPVSVAMARRPLFTRRLAAVLDPRRHRTTPGRGVVLAAACVLLSFLLPLASISRDTETATAAVDHRAQAAGLVAATPGSPHDCASRDTPSGQDRETIRRAIETNALQMLAAIERRDAAGWARFYARDARLYIPDQRPFRGRRGARDHMEQALAAGIAAVETQRDELEFLGELVYETGSFITRGRNPRSYVKGRYLTVWKWEDGEWLISRDMITIQEVH
ncbi:MAG: M56 family metallopeptidase [bacterium]